MENTTIEHYIEKIERKRETPNLSSNLRIAVLEYFQQIAARSLTAGTADQPARRAATPSSMTTTTTSWLKR